MILASPLTPLEHLLRNVLDWLHTTGHLPWAWSIVALTVIVRMILVPLTVKQIHSMQSLQRHAPEMKAIQQKYKGDKAKQNEELMKFYKENNINPAASCLPMVAQFPVFIALYYVLRNFAKEADKPGAALGDLSWLHFVPSIADKTTAHWSGYILLVVYVGSQMASTLYMSATVDKMQRTLFMLMPLVFVFVVARFPTGLVLYWMTTNLWTVGQGLITRRLVPKTAAPAKSLMEQIREARGGGGSSGGGGGGGNGAKRKPAGPKPAPPAAKAKQPQPPRPVRRKKKARR
jgi:YidC/Oxa1 family membrane protein insertase